MLAEIFEMKLQVFSFKSVQFFPEYNFPIFQLIFCVKNVFDDSWLISLIRSSFLIFCSKQDDIYFFFLFELLLISIIESFEYIKN